MIERREFLQRAAALFGALVVGVRAKPATPPTTITIAEPYGISGRAVMTFAESDHGVDAMRYAQMRQNVHFLSGQRWMVSRDGYTWTDERLAPRRFRWHGWRS